MRPPVHENPGGARLAKQIDQPLGIGTIVVSGRRRVLLEVNGSLVVAGADVPHVHIEAVLMRPVGRKVASAFLAEVEDSYRRGRAILANPFLADLLYLGDQPTRARPVIRIDTVGAQEVVVPHALVRQARVTAQAPACGNPVMNARGPTRGRRSVIGPGKGKRRRRGKTPGGNRQRERHGKNGPPPTRGTLFSSRALIHECDSSSSARPPGRSSLMGPVRETSCSSVARGRQSRPDRPRSPSVTASSYTDRRPRRTAGIAELPFRTRMACCGGTR